MYYVFITMKEVWKDIKGYEGQFQVSNLGRVKSLCRKVSFGKNYRTIPEKIRKNQKHTSGYEAIVLAYKGKNIYIHRLVANAFISNPKNLKFVNHINGKKTDNRVENLEWCTPKENCAHALKIGCLKNIIGSNHHLTVLNEKQVIEIRSKYIPKKYTQKMLGDEYGVSSFVIRDIVNKITWKHI